MKITTLLTALLALLVSAIPAFAQTPAQSSPEDRQRFVTLVHNLERTPLDLNLQADRSWAIQWLTDAPDVSVTVCTDPLGGIPAKEFPYGAEIIVQYMLGMGAFALENQSKANDAEAQQLAGVESALTAYRTMRTARADQKLTALEKLLVMQSRGQLAGFVQKAFRQCRAKGG